MDSLSAASAPCSKPLTICLCINPTDAGSLNECGLIGDLYENGNGEFGVDTWKGWIEGKSSLSVTVSSLVIDSGDQRWNDKLKNVFHECSEKNLVLVLFESGPDTNKNIASGYRDVLSRAKKAAVPVIAVCWTNPDLQKELNRPEYQRIPRKGGCLCDLKTRPEKIRCMSDDLISVLSAINETSVPGPRVGVGALLQNSKHEFLLTRRKCPPGIGKTSTVGGRLKLGETINEGLVRCLADQLEGVDESKLRVGPLLACTNMFADSPDDHYVDLTFHVCVDDKAQGWGIRGDRYGYFGDPPMNGKLWFDFRYVYDVFHAKREEFLEPVANAFEQFLIFRSLSDLSFGASAWPPGGSALAIAPDTLDGKGRCLADMSNLSGYLLCCLKVNATSPLFFESESTRNGRPHFGR